MKRAKLTLTTIVLALVVSFGSTIVSANYPAAPVEYTPASAGHSAEAVGYRDDTVRVDIPIHENGPESINLKKLIKRNLRVDLDHYSLSAVVLRNGPFSNGYASLRVGDRRSNRIFLSGRETVRIPAPGRADDHWRLRLGPGAQVNTVTVVLDPQGRRYSGHGYSANGYSSDRHSGSYDPVYDEPRGHDRRRSNSVPYIAAGLVRMLQDDRTDKRRAKKHKRRLKVARLKEARLKETRRKLNRAEQKLARSRNQNKHAKGRQQRIERVASSQRPASKRNSDRQRPTHRNRQS